MNASVVKATLVGLVSVLAVGCSGVADDGEEPEEDVDQTESALAYPSFDVPFKCGVRVVGSTWAAHSPLKAIDFRLPSGSRVDASAGGTISYEDRGNASYGKNLVINHGNGWSTRYAHLSRPLVTSGTVRKGQPIAYSGDSGKARGAPHLHYEQIKSGAVVALRFSSGPNPGYPDTKYTYSGGCS